MKAQMSVLSAEIQVDCTYCSQVVMQDHDDLVLLTVFTLPFRRQEKPSRKSLRQNVFESRFFNEHVTNAWSVI